MAPAKSRPKFERGLVCPDCHGRLRYTTATWQYRPIFQCVSCGTLYTCKYAVWAPFKPQGKSNSPGVIPEAP